MPLLIGLLGSRPGLRQASVEMDCHLRGVPTSHNRMQLGAAVDGLSLLRLSFTSADDCNLDALVHCLPRRARSVSLDLKTTAFLRSLPEGLLGNEELSLTAGPLDQSVLDSFLKDESFSSGSAGQDPRAALRHLSVVLMAEETDMTAFGQLLSRCPSLGSLGVELLTEDLALVSQSALCAFTAALRQLPGSYGELEVKLSCGMGGLPGRVPCSGCTPVAGPSSVRGA